MFVALDLKVKNKNGMLFLFRKEHPMNKNIFNSMFVRKLMVYIVFSVVALLCAELLTATYPESLGYQITGDRSIDKCKEQ